MRRRALLALAAAAALAAGPEAWAKLLWIAGAPGLALPLVRDEAVRGAVLYDLGRYAEADLSFRAVGRSATYDRGLSLAMTGDYRLSVAYFDAVLFADQFDADARRNRDAVAALVDPVVGDAMGHGRIRALLTGLGVESEAFDPEHPELAVTSAERDPRRRSVRRPIADERAVAAGADWIETLADAPGEYLKARLAAELERRRAAGEAMPETPSPW